MTVVLHPENPTAEENHFRRHHSSPQHCATNTQRRPCLLSPQISITGAQRQRDLSSPSFFTKNMPRLATTTADQSDDDPMNDFEDQTGQQNESGFSFSMSPPLFPPDLATPMQQSTNDYQKLHFSTNLHKQQSTNLTKLYENIITHSSKATQRITTTTPEKILSSITDQRKSLRTTAAKPVTTTTTTTNTPSRKSAKPVTTTTTNTPSRKSSRISAKALSTTSKKIEIPEPETTATPVKRITSSAKTTPAPVAFPRNTTAPAKTPHHSVLARTLKTSSRTPRSTKRAPKDVPTTTPAKRVTASAKTSAKTQIAPKDVSTTTPAKRVTASAKTPKQIAKTPKAPKTITSPVSFPMDTPSSTTILATPNHSLRTPKDLLQTPSVFQSSRSLSTARKVYSKGNSIRRKNLVENVRTPTMLSEAFKLKRPPKAGGHCVDGDVTRKLCLNPTANVGVMEQKVCRSFY